MNNVTETAIVREARTWIDTPYKHQAAVKGVGCDCLGMMRGVWSAVTCNPLPDTPIYTPDWNGADLVETLYAGAAQYLVEVSFLHLPKDQQRMVIRDGDVLLFRMVANRAAKHCGVASTQRGARSIIHAYNQRSHRNSVVEETRLDAGWFNRLAYIFRFEELI